MSQSNSGVKGYVASEAIAYALRVKLSSGQAAIAGDGEEGVGTCTKSTDSGDTCPVKLDNASGTVVVIASGTVASGANCYGAASGEVSTTISGRRIGVHAGDVAAATGEYFEMMPCGVNS